MAEGGAEARGMFPVSSLTMALFPERLASRLESDFHPCRARATTNFGHVPARSINPSS